MGFWIILVISNRAGSNPLPTGRCVWGRRIITLPYSIRASFAARMGDLNSSYRAIILQY
jgi:hypothetical protein